MVVEIHLNIVKVERSVLMNALKEREEENSGIIPKMGHPMQIEVPSDKYEVAVAAMEEKIKSGQVKGVTNPSEAKNIVRKGHFTYEQAKNIAKAGKVESLTYDAVNGAIIASSAFGVSAVISFACSMWNGEKPDIALKKAIYSGIKVCGTTFITSVLASQLSKAGLNSALVGSSEAMVSLIGPKASAVISQCIQRCREYIWCGSNEKCCKTLKRKYNYSRNYSGSSYVKRYCRYI